jgi:DNA polymerase-3 subunit alpha
VKIANACNLKIEIGKWYFPEIEALPGKTHDDILRELAFLGIEKRKLEKTPELLERLEYELKIIKTKAMPNISGLCPTCCIMLMNTRF